jgi:hypothetical protein
LSVDFLPIGGDTRASELWLDFGLSSLGLEALPPGLESLINLF